MQSIQDIVSHPAAPIMTVEHACAAADDCAILKYLIGSGACPVDDRVFRLAAYKGNKACLAYLLRYSLGEHKMMYPATFELMGSIGLYDATEQGHQDCMDYLAEQGFVITELAKEYSLTESNKAESHPGDILY